MDLIERCVAIKRYKADGALREHSMFLKELEVLLHSPPHPNILKIIGVCHERAFCVLYEYMPLELSKVLHQVRQLPSPESGTRLAIATQQRLVLLFICV